MNQDLPLPLPGNPLNPPPVRPNPAMPTLADNIAARAAQGDQGMAGVVPQIPFNLPPSNAPSVFAGGASGLADPNAPTKLGATPPGPPAPKTGLDAGAAPALKPVANPDGHPAAKGPSVDDLRGLTMAHLQAIAQFLPPQLNQHDQVMLSAHQIAQKQLAANLQAADEAWKEAKTKAGSNEGLLANAEKAHNAAYLQHYHTHSNTLQGLLTSGVSLYNRTTDTPN